MSMNEDKCAVFFLDRYNYFGIAEKATDASGSQTLCDLNLAIVNQFDKNVSLLPPSSVGATDQIRLAR